MIKYPPKTSKTLISKKILRLLKESKIRKGWYPMKTIKETNGDRQPICIIRNNKKSHMDYKKLQRFGHHNQSLFLRNLVSLLNAKHWLNIGKKLKRPRMFYKLSNS